MLPSRFASTEENGVDESQPSFHSSAEITPSLFLSSARKRSALVTPFALASPRADLHSRNSLVEILPSDSNKKIEAIKVYREATGVGLAEAKAAVERLPTT